MLDTLASSRPGSWRFAFTLTFPEPSDTRPAEYVTGTGYRLSTLNAPMVVR